MVKSREPGSLLTLKSYSTEVKRHSHDHHQIVLPLAGRLAMAIEGVEDSLHADKAAIIAAGQDHAFEGSRENLFLVLDVPLGLIDREGPRRSRLFESAAQAPFVALDPSLKRLIGALAEEAGQKGFSHSDRYTAGDLLLGALARRMGVEDSEPPPQLAKALLLIEEAVNQGRPVEDLSLSQLAEASGLSQSRLHRLFREHFSQSPGHYISQRRLALAARLLSTEEQQIAQVAFRAGYNDQSSFTRAFTRTFGESPTAYRERHRVSLQVSDPHESGKDLL